MNLPVLSVFVNSRFGSILSPLVKQASLVLQDVECAFNTPFSGDAIVVISGSLAFMERFRSRIAPLSRVIWSFEQPFRHQPYTSWHKQLKKVAKTAHMWGMVSKFFPHALYGGGTNACHLLSFGADFHLRMSSFQHPPNVRRVIGHFWNDAARVRLEECSEAPPTSDSPSSKVIKFNNMLSSAGLLHVYNPFSLICGRSVFKPGRFVHRRLTPAELNRLYDLPLVCDSALPESLYRSQGILPFESAISPAVLASLCRYLWSVDVGGSVSSPPLSVSPLLTSSEVPTVATSQVDLVDECEDEMSTSSVVLSDGIGGSTLDVDKTPISSDSLSDDRDGCSLDSAGSNSAHSDSAGFLHDCDDPALDLVSVTSDSAPEVIIVNQLEDDSGSVESDSDSLMYRPATGRRPKPSPKLSTDWENLEDESTCCLDQQQLHSSVADTESLTSYGSESYQSNASDNSTIADASVSTASISIASEATQVTRPVTQEVLDNIAQATIGQKAVKADDAEVPVHLWNLRIIADTEPEMIALKEKALKGFRILGLRLFWRSLYKDCIDRLHRKFGRAWPLMSQRTASGKLTRVGREREAMSNLLWHSCNASWFEYHCGSRVYHFRFPLRYQKMARDGVKIFFEKPGPQIMQPQPEFADPEVRARVKPKVEKVIRRRYMTRVTTGLKLKSLIKYFAVPKGLDDVRIVYDGTASGLNDAVWAPSFWLPTIDSLVRALDSSSWMSDRDIGDMFLNFQLHESAWPFAGVDVKPILDDDGRISKHRWYYWVRNAMGFKSSPYNSIKMALVAEEVVHGDRRSLSNPFQWDHVRLNLPGTLSYDPSKTWIARVRSDGMLACVLFTFVDDERIAAPTRELAWQASTRLAKIQAYLGIQDAARKVGLSLQQPRSWAGAVVHSIPGEGVFVLTSEEKWVRLKEIVDKWLDQLDRGAKNLSHKELLSDRGFLVYVTRAYPAMIPYVKGFHLTAEMWRGNRDEEGWKLPVTERARLDRGTGGTVDVDDEDNAALEHIARKSLATVERAPPSGLTPPAPRLRDDLLALKELTKSELPPLRLARPKRVVHVFYGFGDASGKGRGSTFQGFNTVHHPSSDLGASTGVAFRVGVWGADEERESSNYRELTNLVEDTEAEAQLGNLRETELFLFTDNSTAESAFYKGSSSSKLLHALVLRLHKLQVEYQVIIHLIHVSGKRMIAQGTDGCSRGVLLEGVMAGKDMLSYIDLDKTAFQRHPLLLDWVRSWSMQDDLEPLTPEEWYVEGHGIVGGYLDAHGVWMPEHEESGKLHLWAPPPAVADAMLEELLKARHKRTDTFHVIVVPRLMAPRWRRLFHKVSDIHFVVPPGASFWPANMFEPLWIGIVLPFIPHRPWALKRAPLMVELGIKLCEVCKESDFLARNILRKLLKLPSRLAGVSPSVARGVLHMPSDGSLSNHGSVR